jgi:organic radical activating enzyme
MIMSTIRVSETFYSIQGEGITVGVPAVFIRLQGCNLDCGSKGGTWVCDTEAVWKQGERYSISDFAAIIEFNYGQAIANGAHLIITGGEPLLQQDAIIDLIAKLHIKPTIEIETNGTILPIEALQALVNHWNVSPKLSNSGEPQNKRIQPALQWFSNQSNAIFKFVVSNQNDIDEVEHSFTWLKQLSIRQKFLMPAADNRLDLHQQYESIIELAKLKGFSLSQRFHLTVWDQKTGI